jgi:hypothetical protein
MPELKRFSVMSRRVYLIDGPGAGRTLQSAQPPAQLSWEQHSYRRIVHFASTYFYRHVT